MVMEIEIPNKVYVKAVEAARGSILLATTDPNNGAKEEFIRKDFVIQYLERVIEPQQQIVDVYVQQKAYEGGKLRAYKEILGDLRKM